MKYEFNTKLNVENKTRIDNTGLFANGVNTPHDIPALLTVGVSYEILPVLRASVGYHHFFDTNARMADAKDPVTGQTMGKQHFIKQGTNEYLGGIEWDVCKWAQVSAGMQRTKYGVGDNYQSDMSFAVSSYSYGFGAGFDIAKNLKLNVAISGPITINIQKRLLTMGVPESPEKMSSPVPTKCSVSVSTISSDATLIG